MISRAQQPTGEREVEACTAAYVSAAEELAKRSTIGLFYVRDHVKTSAPELLRSCDTAKRQVARLEAQEQDIASTAEAVKCFVAVAPPRVASMQQHLTAASAAARLPTASASGWLPQFVSKR